MFRSSLLIAMTLAAFACAKDKGKTNDTTAAGSSAGSGSAMVGSGSATGSGSGSDMGSGSAMTGSGSDAGSAAGSGSAGSGAMTAEAGSGSAGDFDFDKLTHDEKVKFMKTKVMPAMKPAFQKFDAKKFANFTCKTCHGKDPAKSKYEMPTADLPVLDFEKIKAGKADPEALEFMSKVVKPEMAKLLNEPEMTETQKGFGCLECHTAKK